VTILVSALVGFEHKTKAGPDLIADPAARELVTSYAEVDQRLRELLAEVTSQSAQLRALEKADDARAAANLAHHIDLARVDIATLEEENKERLRQIRKLDFVRAEAPEDQPAMLYLADSVPAEVAVSGRHWHFKRIEQGKVHLTGGGDVVGKIPAGLPALRIPPISLEAALQLLSAAFIIALVAFMESISMAKALAAQTKQRLDPNQELIGQGLANIGGSFFQAYPACGSFTGSAINLQAGAKTGFAMVFNGLFVGVTLLFLTPFLYHLPKATLAVIILLAVTSLITPKALKHTWLASRADGFVALATFLLTLIAAPHLDKGILFGAALAILLYLYRTMKPRVAILGRCADGTLRDIKVNPSLVTSRHVIALRFDGALYFANVSHFEDAVLEAVASYQEAKYLLVVGNGINRIDASGEEVVHHLVERLRETGVEVVFSGLKKQILDVMRATGLFGLIGAENIFPTENKALAHIYEHLGAAAADDMLCPPAPVRP
jgi:SulP family sulfate permease